MQTLARAGELTLKLPKDINTEAFGKHKKRASSLRPAEVSNKKADEPPGRALSIVARNDPNTKDFVDKFVQKHCEIHASDEWRQVDDRKLDKLRAILAALKEENQSTQLLKKESEDREVDRALQAMRLDHDRRVKECEKLEKEYEARESELKQLVERSKVEMVQCQTNFEKGDRKTKEEAAECRRLDAEIQAVKDAIKEQEDNRVEEEEEIRRAAEHKAFLERVVLECEEDFENDIKVLMNRYQTLDAERQSLHNRNKELEMDLNRTREESLKDQAEMQTAQMVSSSRLHEDQVLLERLRVENTELEERLNRLIAEREERKSQVGVTTMAIEQIFARIVDTCRLKQRKEAMLAEVEGRDKKFMPVRSGVKADPKLDAMLNQIVARLKDLRAMSKEIRDHFERQRRGEVDTYVDADGIPKASPSTTTVAAASPGKATEQDASHPAGSAGGQALEGSAGSTSRRH
mmetsp:Transcript_48510/g.104542  ORF Transcript_48510/g.104542 Transcript_48510/m.104542 type:complete len:463 (+) Transcript_48510:24-1412(+)